MPTLTARLRTRFLPFLCALACLAAWTAAGDPETNAVFRIRAENAFQRTQLLYRADMTNVTNAWQYASACYDLVEFATNIDRRAELARLGIAACQQALLRDSNSAAAHYYLAMDSGALADAEAPSLLSYRLVHVMEHEFKTSAALDERFDYGGAVRCLGLLYRDAPGWPISIGNRRRARENLEHAAKLVPDYPENQMLLVETFLQWRQRAEAEKALKKLNAIWGGAQAKLTGELWEKPWYDWTRRRAAARVEFLRLFNYVPGT